MSPAIKINPSMALGAVVGSTGFFMVHGFNENILEETIFYLTMGNQFRHHDKPF